MTHDQQTTMRSTTTSPNDIKNITDLLRAFAVERDWEKFHTPKNLIMALTGEVGELSELFQWLSIEGIAKSVQDPVFMERVGDEIADVAAYVFRLADVLGIDLSQAMIAKIDKNAQKYPVEKARGSARKYSEL